MSPLVLVVDNYDSFTFNLVQYVGELGARFEVFRNDAIDVDGIRARRPDGVLFSPGPCTPDEAGVTVPAIRALAGEVPILGVCLGHQAIGQAFGGKVVRNERILHGKASPVLHRGEGLFAGLPSPFAAGRYHSLVVERATLPPCLEVTAWTVEREIMGLRHRSLEVEGVQFHPESILTEGGKTLLGNWLARLGGPAGARKRGEARRGPARRPTNAAPPPPPTRASRRREVAGPAPRGEERRSGRAAVRGTGGSGGRAPRGGGGEAGGRERQRAQGAARRPPPGGTPRSKDHA